MKKYILTLTFLVSAALSFGDNFASMSSYKAGDSLKWYYEIKADSLKKPVETEKRIIEAMRAGLSDEAFARACEILKPIATEESLQVLTQNLDSEFRAPWACDVLRVLESEKVDGALKNALPSLKGRSAECVVATLAARRANFDESHWSDIFGLSNSTADTIAKYTRSNDRELANFAVAALGKFSDDDTAELLAEIAGKHDFRRDAAVRALCQVAVKAFAKGDTKTAANALKSVPADYSPSVALRAKLSPDTVEYLDKLLADDDPNMKYAARLAGFARTFENSKVLFEKFPSMSDKAKTYAIGSFTMTNDKRFFELSKQCLDAKNPALKAAAVYSARFLCDDTDSFEKILAMCDTSDLLSDDFNDSIYAMTYGSPEDMLRSIAAKVILENKSPKLDALLKTKAEEGNLEALGFLAKRGDTEAAAVLSEKFYVGGYDNKQIVKIIDSAISFADLKDFAKILKVSKDEALNEAIADVIVKKFAKSKNPEFVERELDAALWGSIDFDGALYKKICKKLKIDKRRKVGVQMSTFYNLSFVDSLPLLKKTGITHIGLTSQKIGGKYPDAKTNETSTPEQRTYLKKILAENSLVVVSFGVRSPENEEGVKAVCEFAKEFSVPLVLTESPENMFPVWQKYAEKYNLKIAVHNHPKPDGSDYKYCYPDYVESLLRPHSRLYSCADNGHWVRGGIKTIDAFRILKNKIGVLHIKDVDKFGTNAANDVQIGTGIDDIKGALAELDAQKFDGWFLIEHEVWKFTKPEKQIEEIRANKDFIKRN